LAIKKNNSKHVRLKILKMQLYTQQNKKK